jgi:hypothetical protein
LSRARVAGRPDGPCTAAGHRIYHHCGAPTARGAAELRLPSLSASKCVLASFVLLRGPVFDLPDAPRPQEGNEYLDGVNNVCHVGHCHPHVVAEASSQMATLLTNSRYLHPAILRYSRRLAATMPGNLKVVYWVNSGSEANDLALRIARAHTGRRGVITVGACRGAAEMACKRSHQAAGYLRGVPPLVPLSGRRWRLPRPHPDGAGDVAVQIRAAGLRAGPPTVGEGGAHPGRLLG